MGCPMLDASTKMVGRNRSTERQGAMAIDKITREHKPRSADPTRPYLGPLTKDVLTKKHPAIYNTRCVHQDDMGLWCRADTEDGRLFCPRHFDSDGYADRLTQAMKDAKARCREAYPAQTWTQGELFG